jgi:hypothetical protein
LRCRSQGAVTAAGPQRARPQSAITNAERRAPSKGGHEEASDPKSSEFWMKAARQLSATASTDPESRVLSQGAVRREPSEGGRSRTRSREGSKESRPSTANGEVRSSEVQFNGYQTFAEGVYAYSQRRGAAARRNLMTFKSKPVSAGTNESKLGTTRAPSPFMPGGRCVTFGEAMHVYNTRGFGVVRGAPLSRAASLPRLPKPVACA